MEQEKRVEILNRALEHFGANAQIEKAIEEYAELIVALKHYMAGKATRREVITEIADVEIMNKQVQIIFGTDAVRDEIDYKLERLRGWLESGLMPLESKQ